MKKNEFRNALKTSIPDASPLFGYTIRKTLARIAHSEAQKEGTASIKMIPSKRRTLTLAVAVLLLLAAVAAAATLLARNVFDVTLGNTPPNASSLTQYDLANETIGNAEITLKEAAYDGMSLYVLYSIRDVTATEPLGEMDEESGERYLRQEDYEHLETLDVGWWWDNLWIDGKMIDMPQMSGGHELPGEENGEILYYMQYRLDQENVYLDGTDVEIALPIGKRQRMDILVTDPETRMIEKPQKGMLTFRMNCSDRAQVTAEEPNFPMEGPHWRARVSNVVYSPIQMYITLDWAVRPEVLEAYIAENGDGYYENGIKYWDYDGLEVCGDEIMNLVLTDEAGNPVFENMQGFYGCGGAGNTRAWYTFPYAKQYPDPMYLMPATDGTPDPSLAIRVR